MENTTNFEWICEEANRWWALTWEIERQLRMKWEKNKVVRKECWGDWFYLWGNFCFHWIRLNKKKNHFYFSDKRSFLMGMEIKVHAIERPCYCLFIGLKGSTRRKLSLISTYIKQIQIGDANWQTNKHISHRINIQIPPIYLNMHILVYIIYIAVTDEITFSLFISHSQEWDADYLYLHIFQL